MQKRRVALASIMAALFILAASIYSAAAAEDSMTLGELARGSDLVVAARIASVEGSESGGVPVISHRLEVIETVHGTAPAEVFVFVPGKVSAGRTIAVTGAPALPPGSLALLFLEADDGGKGYRVVGFNQGLLPLVRFEDDGPWLTEISAAAPGAGGPVWTLLPDLAELVRAARSNSAKAEAGEDRL